MARQSSLLKYTIDVPDMRTSTMGIDTVSRATTGIIPMNIDTIWRINDRHNNTTFGKNSLELNTHFHMHGVWETQSTLGCHRARTMRQA